MLAALAALATRPSRDAHSRTLALVRELAAVRTRARRQPWPSWLIGRDPGQVIADVLDEPAGVNKAAATDVPALR